MAVAESVPAPTELEAGLAPQSDLRLSLLMASLLGGQIDVSEGPFPGENQARNALALGVAIDHMLSRTFYVGLAPQYVVNVQKSLGGESFRQFDVALRMGAQSQLTQRLHLFSHIAGGYSMMLLSADSGLGDTHPKGMFVSFATGGTFDIASSLFATAELGYQLALDKTGVDGGRTLSVNTRFLRCGLGFGLRL
ncbi:MAG TPA: hypothetical protein VGF45_22475 [Polyangia bacterium]